MADYIIRVWPKPPADPFDTSGTYRCEQITTVVPAGADGRCQLWRNHDAALLHAIRYLRDSIVMIRSWSDDPAATSDAVAPVRGDGEAACWAVATFSAWTETRPPEVKQTAIGPTRRRRSAKQSNSIRYGKHSR